MAKAICLSHSNWRPLSIFLLRISLEMVLIRSYALNPSCHIGYIRFCAVLKSPLSQALRIFSSASRFGISQTFKMFSLLIILKPVKVACRLLIAYLISPSAVKISNSIPSLSIVIFSLWAISVSLLQTCSSVSFENLMIEHLDWMGSISLVESLQERINLWRRSNK